MPRRWDRRMSVFITCAVVLATGCATQQARDVPTTLAPTSTAEGALVAKGRELFNDVKLSGDGKWSCASCHPNSAHTNNKTYVGVDVVLHGDPKGRSTPTLWGVGTRQGLFMGRHRPEPAG
jgi:cytochrome c peroxidase